MPNELTTPRSRELRAAVDAMANAPRSTPVAAVRYATILLACWPGQQSQDESVAKVYSRQMVDLLTGVELEILQALIDPKGGFVPKQKFLPSIAEVAGFIDGREGPKRDRIGVYLDEIKELERPPEPVVSDEERKRRADMLRKTADVIRRAAKATQRAAPTPKQTSQGKKLMETDLMLKRAASIETEIGG